MRYIIVIALAFIAPLLIQGCVSGARGWASNYSTANWSSAGLLPDAASVKEPVVQVWSARTGRWKGIVATHSWIVLKPEGASRWERWDVVGWGSPVRRNNYAADARWYSNEPEILLELRGADAAAAIPLLEAAIRSYPFRASGTYKVWPGPNSNTFVAHVLVAEPALAGRLPPTAIGKDFRSDGSILGLSDSGTGVQLSLNGLLGFTMAWVEGLEFNFFGLVLGLDIRRPALKLPAIGRVGMKQD
jgi:hypothetical protein